MKPTPHGNAESPMRARLSPRGATSDAGLGTDAGSAGPAVGDDVVAASHGTLGNAVVRSALAGADDGGIGPVLRSAVMRAAAGIPDTSPGNAELMSALRSGGGQPLPDAVQSKMEQAFGHGFDHVRVHAGGTAGDASASLQAEAFTVGSHIFFGDGEYQPGSAAGERLLAHELTHVVQGDQGRLVGSGVSSPSDPSEREAYGNEDRYKGATGLYGDGGTSSPSRSPSIHARFARSVDGDR
ncbi:MAG: DUF4157 domain-containing protein, partial [Myxococcota bacterium]